MVVGIPAALLVGLLVLGGIVAAAIWLATALFHAAKPDEVPGPNDSNWRRDQGREAK